MGSCSLPSTLTFFESPSGVSKTNTGVTWFVSISSTTTSAPPSLDSVQLCRPVRDGLAAIRLLQMCHRRICQLSVAPRWPLPRCHQSFVIGGPVLRGPSVTFSHWRTHDTPVTIDNAQMAPKSPVSASFARLSPRCQPTGTQETCRRYQHNAAVEKATCAESKCAAMARMTKEKRG